MDWKKVVHEMNKNVGDKYDSSVDTVLDRLGLEQKRNTVDIVLPMLGIFGAGIAVGATLGVLFAPKPGDALRHEIRESLEDLKTKTKEKSESLAEQASEINISNSGTGSSPS